MIILLHVLFKQHYLCRTFTFVISDILLKPPFNQTCFALFHHAILCFLVRTMFVQSFTQQQQFLWAPLKTLQYPDTSRICDITNILEVSLSLISNLWKCDMQNYNFQHTDNLNGLLNYENEHCLHIQRCKEKKLMGF